MKIDFLFCSLLFGTALAVVGCEEKQSPSGVAAIIGQSVEARIKQDSAVSAVSMQPPIQERNVSPRGFVDDSCYTLPACEVLIANWEIKHRD